jgi:Zn-dependent peptidase ImmA (M78 family)/transcriptional regulator with XRE-family HTH domain
MADAVHINPGIFSWARETAGLSIEEAATKLGLKDTGKATAAEKLRQVELGERPVSQSILMKAADVYRRPLITFYLREPPPTAPRGEDFRTVSGAPSPREDAILSTLVRDVRARQSMLRDVLANDEDSEPLGFVGTSKMSEGAPAIAAKIRTTLGVSHADQRRVPDNAALFRLLRAAAERVGIYVLLLGDLGSHHSDVSEEAFRGIALADEVVPFVVINDNDASAARSFTLVHELAHIWIGASGISGPLKGVPENAVERFCNEVAGEFLLPFEATAVLAGAGRLDFARAMSFTDEVARTWHVSQGVVTYRMVLNGWITESVATELFRAFTERWRAEKQRQRELRKPGEAGPPGDMLQRFRLGSGLINIVRRSLDADVLTHTKAAKILGVAPSAVAPLLRGRSRAA